MSNSYGTKKKNGFLEFGIRICSIVGHHFTVSNMICFVRLNHVVTMEKALI